ncbi:MBL fold metallo-hydrolase [Blastochloris viridis]|uniref:Metal-dependent hydrolases of the beta-lactamase superfamily I n=1 Tax=Blastochloris viridis TaxID=1079 RepID=A0A0H5BEQ7_BLAVI|nr:MBL fold metallo-hydrolase [Blastochloris viridis]ALK09414.1 Ribonuclease BN [Blastochloris viridis]BAS00706.1 metal-dependent hydrolases of the beta-lactamase superfamily I [Blastochloris viridis]CUU42077.1 putative hydrolase [Blastochloris viridis]
MTLTATILGCGSSGGVPRVGSGWGRCDPAEPKNRRRRCALLIERTGPAGKTTVLIDAGPDLRQQLLDAGVDRLDGVLLTHEHADHTHGIDDLRPLVIHQRRRIDVYMDAETSAIMRTRFGYCFATPPGSEYPPILTDHRIHAGEPATIEGPGGPVTVLPFRLVHGGTEALGFRVGGLAYSADVSAIPPDSVGAVEGLDTWIVDALRDTPHPSHFCLAEALAWIDQVQPRHAVLTNLHTDLDYRELAQRLPDGVEPAFDGLKIAVTP